MAASSKDINLSPAVDLLTGWDHKIDMDSSAATLFNYFYLEMMGETLADEVGDALWKRDLQMEYRYIPDLLLTRIALETDTPFYDDLSEI